MTVGALGEASGGQQGHGCEKCKYFFHLFKDFWDLIVVIDLQHGKGRNGIRDDPCHYDLFAID
jgi:hypothetical protein